MSLCGFCDDDDEDAVFTLELVCCGLDVDVVVVVEVAPLVGLLDLFAVDEVVEDLESLVESLSLTEEGCCCLAEEADDGRTFAAAAEVLVDAVAAAADAGEDAALVAVSPPDILFEFKTLDLLLTLETLDAEATEAEDTLEASFVIADLGDEGRDAEKEV